MRCLYKIVEKIWLLGMQSLGYEKRMKKRFFFLILKVDFEKACNSINGKTLDYMMRRFGFCDV